VKRIWQIFVQWRTGDWDDVHGETVTVETEGKEGIYHAANRAQHAIWEREGHTTQVNIPNQSFVAKVIYDDDEIEDMADAA
jgi:hypothetical protein